MSAAPQVSDASGVSTAPRVGDAPLVVTVGETMALMRSGTIGSLAHLPTVDIAIGGAESNLAIGLRRLGVPTAWVSRVGDDPLGTRVAREIRAEGVEVHCTIDPTRPTGLMIKSHPTGATTRVDYYRSGSAASALSPADLPDGVLESAEILHVSGITSLLGETAHATLVAAVQRAAAAGTRVCLDVNHRTRLGSREQLAALLGDVLDQVDILIGGPEELSLLAPEADASQPADLLRALARPGRQVVVKLGAAGAAALTDGHLHEAPGHRVDVVDTVGAGDAFVAGYLSALLDGLEVPERLARANACGALACTSPGDWEGTPRLAEVEALLAGGEADPVSR